MKDKKNLEKLKEQGIEEIKKLPMLKGKQDQMILRLQRAENKEQLEEILQETLEEKELLKKFKKYKERHKIKEKIEEAEEIKTLKKEMKKYEKALQEINEELKTKEDIEEIKEALEENFIFLRKVIKQVAKIDEEIILKLDDEIKKLKITYNIIKTN